MKKIKVSQQLIDMLKEVFNIGVGRAAYALSEMLNHLIEMDVPDLFVFDYPSLMKFATQLEGDYICVTQKISGDLEGFGSLTFPVSKGKTLVDGIIGVSLGQSNFNSMEMEAIQEVGNIIINAVGASFDDVLQLKVDYDVPELFFLKTPIPIDLMNKEDTVFYAYAATQLVLEDEVVDGILTMVFAYRDFRTLEQLLIKSGDLSKKFGELLVEAQIITEKQLNEALDFQKDSGKLVGELLVERGYITMEQRNKVLQSKAFQQHARKFGEVLIEENCITPQQLQDVLEHQQRAKSFIGEILIAMGYLDEDSRNQTLTRQLGVKS